MCVQADSRGGYWIGPFRTREDADTANTSSERVMNCDVDEDGFLVLMSDEAIARWEATPLVGLHAAATLPLDTLPHRVEEQTRSLERTEEEISECDSFDISLRDESDIARWAAGLHHQMNYLFVRTARAGRLEACAMVTSGSPSGWFAGLATGSCAAGERTP